MGAAFAFRGLRLSCQVFLGVVAVALGGVGRLGHIDWWVVLTWVRPYSGWLPASGGVVVILPGQSCRGSGLGRCWLHWTR